MESHHADHSIGDESNKLSSTRHSPRRVINPAAHSKYLRNSKPMVPEHFASHEIIEKEPPDAFSTSSKSNNINTASTLSSSHSPRRSIFSHSRPQGANDGNVNAARSATSSISTEKRDNESTLDTTSGASLRGQLCRPIHPLEERAPLVYIEKRHPNPQSEVPTAVSWKNTTVNKKSQQQPTLTLEKRLFHEIHKREIRTPSIKEFKECWAFGTFENYRNCYFF